MAAFAAVKGRSQAAILSAPATAPVSSKTLAEAQKMALDMARQRAQSPIPPKVAVNLRGDLDPGTAHELASGQPIQPAAGSNAAAAASGL
jgi:hypothetical protein